MATTSWRDDTDFMRCPTCTGRLDLGDNAMTCPNCARSYPIRDGVVDMLPSLEGNNKVTADFYNGPLWPKFRFWEWFTFWCNGGERKARSHIIKHLPDLGGTRLLDVAIGDGSNLPLIPDDCRVYGNDISTVQITGCQRRFPQRDLHLILCEAEALPFRDGVFDNVLSVGAFNYFNDPLKSLKEMARVVKPGGLVVVSDEVPDLPNYLIGRKIGWPGLDHWVMSRFMSLGPDFADMVDRHRDLKLEPIVREVLDDGKIHMLWQKVGYVFVGRPRA